MTVIKTKVLPILLATISISMSEFVRNELLVKSFWTEHYQKLGLDVPPKQELLTLVGSSKNIFQQ